MISVFLVEIFNPDVGGNILPGSMRSFPPDYIASHPRRQESSPFMSFQSCWNTVIKLALS